MSFIRRIFFDEDPHKAILTNQPVPIIYALETMVYMLNSNLSADESPISKDDVIQVALRQYLKRNLSTTPKEVVEKKDNAPPPHFEDYRTGRKQTRR